eukprot:2556874-Lingulodinium_polyedra.AAC.1
MGCHAPRAANHTSRVSRAAPRDAHCAPLGTARGKLRGPRKRGAPDCQRARQRTHAAAPGKQRRKR